MKCYPNTIRDDFPWNMFIWFSWGLRLSLRSFQALVPFCSSFSVIFIPKTYVIFLRFFPPGTTQTIVGVYFTTLYRALATSRTSLLDHTQRRVTVGRTPLNEWSVRRRDLYLTTHNTHNRETSVPRVGFEPTIAAGERL